MTGNICISTSFLRDGIFLSRVQILLTLLLGLGAIRVAFLIYIRQNKNLNKDAILNRALQKAILLSTDINVGQRKLEFETLLLKEAEDKGNIELIKIHTESLKEIQITLDQYYKSRNEALDLYDKEIKSK